LKFPTSMSLSVWGVAAQLCPQLPPQSGISYVTDYIDLNSGSQIFLMMMGVACMLACF
jgi:hypothetical protein